MTTIAIVGGGPESYIPELSPERASVWIGADHGARVLLEREMPLDIAVGDFDSVTDEMLAVIKQKAGRAVIHPPEKNETDLELAVQEAVDYGASQLIIYGVTGGRMDHTLANIQLLYPLVLQKINAYLIDRQNEMELKLPGTHTLQYSATYPYISFLPISLNVKGLSLDGFKYPLEKENVPIGSTLCLSNEVIGNTGTYSFDHGIVLVVRSRDEGA